MRVGWLRLFFGVGLVVSGCGKSDQAHAAPAAAPVSAAPRPAPAPAAARPSPPPTTVASPPPLPSPSPSPSPVAEPSPVDEPIPVEPPPLLYRGQPVDQLVRDMAQKPVVAMKKRFARKEPVYWLELEGGLQVAFKPQTDERPGLWRNDVVGWELARLLGLTARTPPAVGRYVPLAMLKGPLEVIYVGKDNPPGMVWGSTIFWMPVLEKPKISLTGPAGKDAWTRWLDVRRRVPAEYDALAQDVAALVLFDYLTTNGDRFENSENTRVDEEGRLIFRDNNEGFNANVMADLQSNAALLKRVHRFPRFLYEALRVADDRALDAAIKPWADAGRPLFDRERLRYYDQRRLFALAYIDALIERHGEAAILAWP